MGQKKPKVTIVTVTYNAKRYLEQTILSVIGQTYPNIEYIIIDGDSSDGTIDIIKKYEKYITHWISEPDSGIYDAMNKGIDIATGEWINFMNAGDSFVDNDILFKMIDYLDNQTDIIVGGINVVDACNKILQSQQFEGVDNILKYNPCYHQAAFVRSDLMKLKKFDMQYKILSDYNFMLESYLEGRRFKKFSGIVANYMQGGVSGVNSKLASLEGLLIIQNQTSDPHLTLQSYWISGLQNVDYGHFKFSFNFNLIYDQIQNLKDTYSNIAIYGYAKIGQYVHEKLGNKVVAVYDKRFDVHENGSIFYNPAKLQIIEFDIIVICALGKEQEIESYLCHDAHISKDLIYKFDLK